MVLGAFIRVLLSTLQHAQAVTRIWTTGIIVNLVFSCAKKWLVWFATSPCGSAHIWYEYPERNLPQIERLGTWSLSVCIPCLSMVQGWLPSCQPCRRLCLRIGMMCITLKQMFIKRLNVLLLVAGATRVGHGLWNKNQGKKISARISWHVDRNANSSRTEPVHHVICRPLWLFSVHSFQCDCGQIDDKAQREEVRKNCQRTLRFACASEC